MPVLDLRWSDFKRRYGTRRRGNEEEGVFFQFHILHSFRHGYCLGLLLLLLLALLVFLLLLINTIKTMEKHNLLEMHSSSALTTPGKAITKIWSGVSAWWIVVNSNWPETLGTEGLRGVCRCVGVCCLRSISFDVNWHNFTMAANGNEWWKSVH